MKRHVFLSALAIALAAPGSALGCGACVEDKVAAAYDHAVIRTAIARGQQVVFVGIDGPAAAIGPRIVTAARSVQGVYPESVRTSSSPAAFSFALERSRSPDAALAAFRQRIASPGVRFDVIRIMRDGTLTEPR